MHRIQAMILFFMFEYIAFVGKWSEVGVVHPQHTICLLLDLEA